MAERSKARHKGARNDLTADQVREMLDYNPHTGGFHWRVKRRPRIKAGDVAGSTTPYGYISIGLFGIDYLAHILAWLVMTGHFAEHDIDHRDGVGANNRWGNLRAATKSQNLCNQKLSARSTTGYKGVNLFRNGRYRSTITLNGEQKHLGYFDTAIEAHEAYCRAADEIHGEFKRFK